ncbi:hypothetical protein APU55_01360 [Campylobacter jejuni]|nr:hypothetical protein [Campylobacter jejuni]
MDINFRELEDFSQKLLKLDFQNLETILSIYCCKILHHEKLNLEQFANNRDEIFTYLDLKAKNFKNIYDFSDENDLPNLLYFLYFYIKEFDLENPFIVDFALKILKSESKIYCPFCKSFFPTLFKNEIFIQSKQNQCIALIMQRLYEKKFEYSSEEIDFDVKEFKDFTLLFTPLSKKPELNIAQIEWALRITQKRLLVCAPLSFTSSTYCKDLRKNMIDSGYLQAVISVNSKINTNITSGSALFLFDKECKNDKVYFLNLDSFLLQEGSFYFFKSDELVEFFEKKEIKNTISYILDSQSLTNNNANLDFENLLYFQQMQEYKQKFKEQNFTSLENIAQIRISQSFKKSEIGEEIFELSFSDIPACGFVTKGSKSIITSEIKKINTYKLEPYDVILSAKGIIGQVAIVGKDIEGILVASQNFRIIRFKNPNFQQKELYSIALYMFLKSDFLQLNLKSKVEKLLMPHISIEVLNQLEIPIFTEEYLNKMQENFKQEQELYQKIKELQEQIQILHKS